MGCSPSSINRMESQHLFNAADILYLTQSWNVIKAHEFRKFVQSVLIRTTNQSRSFRQFCISKVKADANNYDYSQHESCLRTALSWQIALPDCSVQVAAVMDKLLAALTNAHHFQIQLQSIELTGDLFPIEYETLLIMKQSILDVLHERCKMTDYRLQDDYEEAWNKLLSFIIEHIPKQSIVNSESTQTFTSIVVNTK